MLEDGRGVHPVDDDELLPTGCTRHDPHVALGDAELRGDHPDERRVRGAFDGGGTDPGPEHAIEHAIDMVGRRSRGETDGEANVSGTQRLTCFARAGRG